MKYAYIDPDNSVREIIPEGAFPIEEWYNEEFASHCVEIPDHVQPNWVFDFEKNEWLPPEEYHSTVEKLKMAIDTV